MEYSQVSSSTEGGHRGRVIVIAVNNLRTDSRVQKEAASLTDAGYEAIRVGIVARPDDMQEETTPYGKIVRVVTSMAPYEPKADGASGSRAAAGMSGAMSSRSRLRRAMLLVSKGPLNDIRIFLGRVRENVVIYQQARGLRPDVVIACDLNALLAGWLLKRRGAGLIYDSHELFTETSNVPTKFLKWLYGMLERLLIGRADGWVTVCDGVADELMRRYGIPRPEIVMNGSAGCLNSSHAVSTPMKFYFQGNYTPDRHLEDVVSAMTAVRGRATLDMQGRGPAEPLLRQRVSELGLEDTVRFLEPCRPEETVQAAGGYDVGLINLRPVTLNLRWAIPVKLFDYFGGGLAVLSARNEAIPPILDESECGLTYDSFNLDELQRAMVYLVENPDEVVRMKRNASLACPRYTWDSQVEPLLQMAERLAAARGEA